MSKYMFLKPISTIQIAYKDNTNAKITQIMSNFNKKYNSTFETKVYMNMWKTHYMLER